MNIWRWCIYLDLSVDIEMVHSQYNTFVMGCIVGRLTVCYCGIGRFNLLSPMDGALSCVVRGLVLDDGDDKERSCTMYCSGAGD